MKILHIYILQIVLLVIRYGKKLFYSYIIWNNKLCLASKLCIEKKRLSIYEQNTNFEAHVKIVFYDIFFVHL